uniref:Putative secreted protein n=1 Tax=Anopheles marajoara TaxID=58244 RepID=A0A2M4CCR7_9DIPT
MMMMMIVGWSVGWLCAELHRPCGAFKILHQMQSGGYHRSPPRWHWLPGRAATTGHRLVRVPVRSVVEMVHFPRRS